MEGKFLTAKKDGCRIRLVFWLAALTVAYATDKVLLMVCAVLAIVVEILVRTFNQNSYFRMEEGRVCAQYHWFGRLDCSLDEVAYSYAQTINLQILLKNGKHCSIGFLANAHELRNEIQRQIFSMEREKTNVLKNQLARIHEKRRRDICCVIAGCGMMYLNIFFTVWITGAREFSAFTRRDWILFWVMTIIETGTVAAALALASRCGQRLVDLAYLRHRIQGAVIVTQILPSACVKTVYTDPQFNGRLVVCVIPNDGSMYYIVQEFDDDFRLVTTETSRFFEDDAELEEDLSPDLMDITNWFL